MLVTLTQGKVAIIDDNDADLVTGLRWHTARSGNTWYALSSWWSPELQRTVTVRMHRLIAEPPSGMQVDHIDGDGLNNRRSNLRVCSKTDNNRHSLHRKSGAWSSFRGVSRKFYPRRKKRLGRWYAQIEVNGRNIHLGYFDTEEEAAHAYDEAAVQHFGEFACLNFPRKARSNA